jgi:hypothetical protein
MRPVQRRAAQSWTPNRLSAAAPAQYCSGGFSKYLKPFSRGVTQSPLCAISREISP